MALTKKVAITCADTEKAQAISQFLQERLNIVPFEEAELIIAVGGDGVMLRSLHQTLRHQNIPVYGINRGSYGFLMNHIDESVVESEKIVENIENAEEVVIYPLLMEVTCSDGKKYSHYAINEVSIFRRTAQIAKLKIYIDSHLRMEELWCDGVLLSTPAGSTAYNYAAYGSIIPLEAKILSLTALAPARPPRWRGALLSNKAVTEIQVLKSDYRPVSAVADNVEVTNIEHVKIYEATNKPLRLLFNPDANLADRILRQQFLTETEWNFK